MEKADEKAESTVAHLRQILLWPVYLLPLDEDGSGKDHWDLICEPSPQNPWRQIDDEFGDPDEFQARHYNEFVAFLPPVQRFLYGQGIGRAVRKVYGESPIEILRRSDIARARVTLDKDGTPIEVGVKHIDLYFFYDIDVVLVAIEIFADNLPYRVAQDLLFRLGRAYPAYWEASGRAGHCPWKVEWLAADGTVLATSDYERREKYLSFVCRHRAPAMASHWEFLIAPLVLLHSDRRGELRYRQLEYYRMPYMALLAMDDVDTLRRDDWVGLAHGAANENGATPSPETFLQDFERDFCFDRFVGVAADLERRARFIATGDALIVVGDARDGFFMNPDGGMLGRFRHQHFLMFLIAHFQKAALRMFSDRLVATVSRLDVKDAKANRVFRGEIRSSLENFLRFAHRYWFHEISNQAETRRLFDMTRKRLDLDALYSEVREELQDMGSFLDVEAARRQNETVVRLTVVTTFGLIGTVTTGFLGMNLLAWADQPVWWRVVAFFIVFVPITFLTLYTILKSRRLSDFLDAMSDESVSWGRRWRALLRVWFGR